MLDEWDELLGGLPSEPCPPDLPDRVKRRLSAARRKRIWRRAGFHVLLALTAAAGAWMIRPWLGQVAPGIVAADPTGTLAWLEFALVSPLSAAADLFMQTQSWSSKLEIGMITAVVLLMPSIFYGLDRLLLSEGSREGAVQ